MTFGLEAGRDGGRFVHREPEPVHAGVNVECGTPAPIVDGDERIPLGKLGRAVDDRLQIVVGEGLRRTRHDSVENVDRRLGRQRPHAPTFGDVGDKEGPAPGFRQCLRDRFEPAAITVAFDYGGAFDRHGGAGEHPPIRLDGGKIDAQKTTRFRWVGSIVRRVDMAQIGVVDGHE
jgi:hypothetical protein